MLRATGTGAGAEVIKDVCWYGQKKYITTCMQIFNVPLITMASARKSG